MFEVSLIPTINKPTRVTKHTATTNYILNSNFKSTIVRTNLSDHLLIIFINEFKRDPIPTDYIEKCVHKRGFNENAFDCFAQALFETSWNSVQNLKRPNEAYNKYFEVFTKHYDKYFVIRIIKIKPKRALSFSITSGIDKSSK